MLKNIKQMPLSLKLITIIMFFSGGYGVYKTVSFFQKFVSGDLGEFARLPAHFEKLILIGSLRNIGLIGVAILLIARKPFAIKLYDMLFSLLIIIHIASGIIFKASIPYPMLIAELVSYFFFMFLLRREKSKEYLNI